MSKIKNNKSIWNTRIKKKTSNLYQKIGGSLNIDKRLFKEDILGSKAHVEMLFKQKIISFKIKNKIIFGLDKIEKEIKNKKFIFKKEYEDIHINIEKRLHEIIGEEAGYIHTARSRNDQVITDFKLWIKSSTMNIDFEIQNLIKSIVKIAEKNVETIMPGFTHLKNAQPISFAHYLLSFVEMFNRDRLRFNNNLENLSENPLGVGALTGTSFDIDRNYTTKKLGFKKPTNNSVDTVSDRDFVLDFLFSSSVCAMHISRIAEELIIWNSDAFRLISLSDQIVTGSSIMPQKKNPDLLEFLRGKTGSSYGNLFSMLTILKGLPMSYFKDLQDDKQLVFSSYDNLIDSLKILNEVINNITPNKKNMIKLAETGFITATDLADYLVKNFSMPFRDAYQKTASIINYAEKNKKELKELTLEELKKFNPKFTNDILSIFELKNSINSKKSFGGTSFSNIKKMIVKYKKNL